METSIYVGLSGQLALQRRLDTIANNVANSTTPGFRAENVTFASVLSKSSVAYSNSGSDTFIRRSGPLTQTDNPLDVAVQGGGFLSLGTPNGTSYTRDGRMRISAAGDLESLEGHAVLDSGGGRIQINTALGPIQIAKNGTISQNGERVATLGLYRIPDDAKLTRGPGVGLIPDRPAEPILDFNDNGFVQGFTEGSNVNPVLEMTRMISVSRAFDALSATLDQSDRKLSDAVRTLGSGSGK